MRSTRLELGYVGRLGDGSMAQAMHERAAVVGRLCGDLQGPISAALQSLHSAEQDGVREPQGLEIPHLSFQLVEGRMSAEALASLKELTRRWPPVEIELSGLGFFYRPRQVLYITVVRSPELDALQEEVSQRLALLGYESHPHYRPETWVPHISLAMDSSIRDWERLAELDESEVFHRRCSVDGLIVLGADITRPVVFEQVLSGRPHVRRSISP